MSFVFQQPGSSSLLDALDAAAANARAGGGMFAFATKAGIQRLLSAPNVERLMSSGGQFHLVVGVDAITNGDALLTLEDEVACYRGALVAHAFLHDYSGTFHPKFSWFTGPGGLTMVAGSGNLTMSGLGFVGGGATPAGNWEAFVTQLLTGTGADATLHTIDQWVQHHLASGHLRPITDAEVRDQAMANSRVRIVPPAAFGRRAAPRAPLSASTVLLRPLVAPLPSVLENDVFIRELPQTRPGQADIGQQGLEFLGFTGVPTAVFLQHVELDNSLGPTTEQRLFVNASQNYRVEMQPIARHGYVVDAYDNRMILVAVKLNGRSYRYTVVPVTHSQYAAVSALLGPPSRLGHGRPMRRLIATSAWLRQSWPNAPENLLPVVGYAIES